MSENLSTYSFHKRFPDEASCIQYLIEKRWNGNPVCLRCGSVNVYTCKTRAIFKCADPDCKYQFSARTGTIFEDSRLPLTKWFLAIYLATSMKRGISSIQLAKQLEITQKSAWHMSHRIREAMRDGTLQILRERIAVDECYIGGHRSGTRGRGAKGKQPIFGLIEAGGKAYILPVPNAKRDTLFPIIEQHVAKGATITSDEFAVYGTLSQHGYEHRTVTHKSWQWATKEGATSNPIEQVWSHYKRMLYGTYLQTSHKHAARYTTEFLYRFNNRGMNDGERFDLLLTQSEGRQLPYQELIN